MTRDEKIEHLKEMIKEGMRNLEFIQDAMWALGLRSLAQIGLDKERQEGLIQAQLCLDKHIPY